MRTSKMKGGDVKGTRVGRNVSSVTNAVAQAQLHMSRCGFLLGVSASACKLKDVGDVGECDKPALLLLAMLQPLSVLLAAASSCSK